MRVTANTFSNSLVDQLGQLNQRQYRLQNQAATGQRITNPEDDPAAMQRVLSLQTESKAVGQYQRNAAVLKEKAQATYQVVRDLKTVSDRAGELSVLGTGSPRSAEDLKVYASEVRELIQQAVQAANGKFRGDYLLSGTMSDRPPFVVETDAAGYVTSVTYQGNESVAESEIAEGTTVSAHVPGANASGSGPRGLITDARSGADFFNHLISLQNHLLAGDTAAIASTDRPGLAQDEENLVLHASENGILQARLESATTSATRRAESLQALISNEVDADLAQTLVRLNQTQTAYQAAMQSGAQLLQSSLLDYLS
jgi:flagellar hook-associated protein 3 FlgL